MSRPESWKGLRKFLANESLTDVLRLIRSENVGPVTFFNLVRQFGAAKSALDAIPDLARNGGKRAPVLCYTTRDAEWEIEQTEKLGARMIRFGEEAYPPLLTQIYDPPPLLIVRGFAHVWQKRRLLAVVGSRNASANGYQLAKRLAADAGSREVGIVSGLARGIDTAAHTGSLASGTVAVMASGIDHVYPPENKALYESICAQGAVVTEQPFGMAPHARSFPGRNRIISGMSHATLVVEASLKSGSLITARFALEQNRDVLAVPGSPMDPRCKGTNSLIKQGAVMCESIEDIMSSLNSEPPLFIGEQDSEKFEQATLKAPQETELAEARKLVSAKLGYSAVAVDELMTQCNLPHNLLSLVLLELELAGRLSRQRGGKVALLTHQEELIS